mgnify:CR=1 FL=1
MSKIPHSIRRGTYQVFSRTLNVFFGVFYVYYSWIRIQLYTRIAAVLRSFYSKYSASSSTLVIIVLESLIDSARQPVWSHSKFTPWEIISRGHHQRFYLTQTTSFYPGVYFLQHIHQVHPELDGTKRNFHVVRHVFSHSKLVQWTQKRSEDSGLLH